MNNGATTGFSGEATFEGSFVKHFISSSIGPFQIYVTFKAIVIVVSAISNNHICRLIIFCNSHPIVHLAIERAGSIHCHAVASGNFGSLHAHVSHDAAQVVYIGLSYGLIGSTIPVIISLGCLAQGHSIHTTIYHLLVAIVVELEVDRGAF